MSLNFLFLSVNRYFGCFGILLHNNAHCSTTGHVPPVLQYYWHFDFLPIPQNAYVGFEYGQVLGTHHGKIQMVCYCLPNWHVLCLPWYVLCTLICRQDPILGRPVPHVHPRRHHLCHQEYAELKTFQKIFAIQIVQLEVLASVLPFLATV